MNGGIAIFSRQIVSSSVSLPNRRPQTRQLARFVVAMVVTVITITTAFAQEAPQPLETPLNAIIITRQARALVGNTPVKTMSPGTLITLTHQRGSWYLMRDIRAWIHQAEFIPLRDANRHFTTIIDRKPTPEAYHHRGIVYAALQNWEAALDDFNEAVRLGDADANLLINRGNALTELRQEERALADYNLAIELDSRQPQAYINRGSLYASLGQLDQALKDLDKAVEVAPELADAYNERGVLHRLREDYVAAVADYTRAIELSPEMAAAWANRAFAQKAQGAYREALDDYNRALSIDPLSDGIANDLAWLLATCPDADIRDSDRAIELAEQACRATNFHNPQYLDTLAAAHAAAGQFAKAAETAEKAIKSFGPDPAATDTRKRLELYRDEKPYIAPHPQAAGDKAQEDASEKPSDADSAPSK